MANNADDIVLFLDYKKAFDSVSHHFLLALLHHVGLPDHFVKWVKIIYKDASSVLRYKNWLTPKFPLGRAVRQGCPLSCHLFNLVGQVVLFSLSDSRFHSQSGMRRGTSRKTDCSAARI